MRTFNTVKTVLLLGLLSAFFLAIGYLIGGQSGMYFALMISLLMNFGAYWFSDKMVLAMHRAKAISADHPSGVYQIVDESGARHSEDPEALASALEKISNPALLKKFREEDMLPDMQPAFSHLYIVNHFSGKSVFSWFSTHPPVTERVKRLLSMGKK